MCSQIPAREPTNTWRSSMSVCPTVSLTLLPLNKTFASSPPTLHSPVHPWLQPARRVTSLLMFICSICNMFQHLFLLLSLSLSHHEPFMKYDPRSLLTLICNVFIIDVLAVLPEDQPGYETAESRQEAGKPVFFMKSVKVRKAPAHLDGLINVRPCDRCWEYANRCIPM